MLRLCLQNNLWLVREDSFFDRLEEGVEQIEAAPKAQVGAVVMNFSNIISHEKCGPILNEVE